MKYIEIAGEVKVTTYWDKAKRDRKAILTIELTRTR